MEDGAPLIDVIVEDERWSEAIADPEGLAEKCRAAGEALEPKLGRSAALLLADDKTLADFNRRFRGKDGPTNVLSFPAGGEFLGDIAIAYDTCEREAAALGLAFRDHVAHLIVHGLLHLAGYDHMADEEAEQMERLETRILAALGVADPYGAMERE